MPYQQLTMNERYSITHMHMAGFTHAQIARRLNRHRATIGRELKRNLDSFGHYHYESAQRLATERNASASQRYKLDTGNALLRKYVCQKLTDRWSPQEISNRMKLDYPSNPSIHVSHETIYRWIYHKHRQGELWYQQLRRRHKRRKSHIVGRRKDLWGQIPGRVGIEQRPASVDNRSRFGHWESDTMEGAKGSGSLLTHVERKSRYTKLGKLTSKQAKQLSRVTTQIMAQVPQRLRRTMTADNGKEFADFSTIEQNLQLKVYFANPHCPWERGTNENTNGLLRDWFPKGSDFSKITPAQLAKVENLLNNRPRKCLNYRTPAEVLSTIPGVALQI